MSLHVENLLWHAFDYLAVETGRTCASKSKLKVLTANLGHILEVRGTEQGLTDYRGTSTLTFDQYRHYVQTEVFSALPDQISVSSALSLEGRMSSVCWLICSPPYLERTGPLLPASCVLQLWRIFCLLAEMVEDEEGRLEVALAASEVEIIAKQFVAGLGRAEDWDPEEFDCVVSVIPAFKFPIFLAVLESKYAVDQDPLTLVEAVRELQDHFLHDVLRKGRLGKQMDYLPLAREHWAVVQPRLLTLYSSTAETRRRAEIPLDPQCRVEAAREDSRVRQRPHRFYLHANQKRYEFHASSHRHRLEWMGALSRAIEHSGPGVRYQLDMARQRREAREQDLARRLSHLDIVEKTKQELEAEKAARESAEEHAALLTEEKELESRRRRELEEIKGELEQLLEEEKQAKRDEEIVRTLQARMLTEEWERRETLEKMQEQQTQMLSLERTKREEWEKVQQEREDKVREAEARIHQLEEERKKLDDELKRHIEKSRRMNIGHEVLEVRMRVKEQECEKEAEAISRSHNLNTQAVSFLRNEDRAKAGYRPMRSASMRETSYSRSIRRQRRQRNDSVSIRSSTLGAEEVNNNGHA